MNFSNYVKRIRRNLRSCLVGDKQEILTGLRQCLLEARSLLKTDDLDFWISQFDQQEMSEFATTRFGLEETRWCLREDVETTENSRSVLLKELQASSENILTFTSDNDLCSMQSQYHWYYSKSDGFVYKESELGELVLPAGKSITGEVRVAGSAELDANPSLLLT